MLRVQTRAPPRRPGLALFFSLHIEEGFTCLLPRQLYPPVSRVKGQDELACGSPLTRQPAADGHLVPAGRFYKLLGTKGGGYDVFD